MRWLVPVFAALALAGCADAGPLPLVGTLERERVVMTAPAAEPVTAVAVAEGDRIAAGEVVARLDDEAARARLASARARAERAAGRLAELEAGPRRQTLTAARARLAGAREQLRLAERTLDRSRRLAERDLASAAEVDEAERAVTAARTERDVAAAQLDELEEGTRSERLVQAREELSAARAEVRRLRSEVADLTLRAPADAVIDALPLNEGERPRPGEAVAVLLAGRPYARVYVPASLRPRLEPGMTARVEVSGGRTYDARIRTVSSEAAFTPFFALTERDRGRLAYRAEIELTGEPGRVPVGAPVEVSFPALAQGGGG